MKLIKLTQYLVINYLSILLIIVSFSCSKPKVVEDDFPSLNREELVALEAKVKEDFSEINRIMSKTTLDFIIEAADAQEISNGVYLVKSDIIQFVKINFERERISSISIKNLTAQKITQIEFSFEKYDINGVLFDSGNFTIENYSYDFGKKKIGELVEPFKTKEIKLDIFPNNITNSKNEVLIIKIEKASYNEFE